MASAQRMHPEPRTQAGMRLQIPGAIQRVPNERRRPAVYLGSKPVTSPQPASNHKSDFAPSALSFWQTNVKAFAARQHLEEP